MKVWALKKRNKYYDGFGAFSELINAEFYRTKKEAPYSSMREEIVKVEIKVVK